MAAWQPQDGTHGALAGAPDQYCYKCRQYCGGTDAGGGPLVCAHCTALGLPPAGTDPKAEDHVPQSGFGAGGSSPGDPYAVTTNTTGDGITQEQPLL